MYSSTNIGIHSKHTQKEYKNSINHKSEQISKRSKSGKVPDNDKNQEQCRLEKNMFLKNGS